MRDAQSDGRSGQARADDALRGVWVHVEVEFRKLGGVAAPIERAAHDDDLPEVPHRLGVLLERRRDIRQRPQRDESDFTGVPFDQVQDHVDSMPAHGRLRGIRITGMPVRIDESADSP